MIGKAAGVGLAVGAWSVNLAFYPLVFAYALAMAPGARAWHAQMNALANPP